MLGERYLFMHPSLDFTKLTNAEGVEIILLGFMLDPNLPDANNDGILSVLAKQSSFDPAEVAHFLYPMSGRFVLMIKKGKDTRVYNDPCGLKMVYFTQHQGAVYLGSQPYIFKLAFDLEPGPRFHQYNNSQYVKNYKEHCLVSGVSLFEEIHHLIPNHLLHLEGFKQERYFPCKELEEKSIDYVVKESSQLLQNSIIAAHKRFNLAFTMTAGTDSRLLFAATKPISKDLYYFTYLHHRLSANSRDIVIPQKLLGSLNLQHSVIKLKNKPDKKFQEIYKRNTPMDHTDDWGYMIGSAMNSFPQNKVSTHGGCDIYKCKFYPDGIKRKINRGEELTNLETIFVDWNELPFLKEAYHKWFSESKDQFDKYNYYVLDMAHWEILNGTWLAQAQTENDMVHDTFTPFNNRKLLDLMLSVDVKYRIKPQNLLFHEMIKFLWPEVLKYPINPAPSFYAKLKRKIKKISGFY